MTKLLFALTLVAVAWAGWTVGAMLSTDAVALLVGYGLCFVTAIAPLALLTLYGRKQAIVVHFHTHEPKQLQQPANQATALITQQPAERWRVLANSTSLAIRESEVTIYGN